MPQLEKELWQPLQSRGLSVLAIGREHELEEVRDYKSQLHLSFILGTDPKRKIYALYANQTIPRNYLINKEGKVVYAHAGFNEKELIKIKELILRELSNNNFVSQNATNSEKEAFYIRNSLQEARNEIANGNYASSINILKQLLSKSSNSAQAHYLLAVSYVKTKQYLLAEEEYKATLNFAQNDNLKALAQSGLNKLEHNR